MSSRQTSLLNHRCAGASRRAWVETVDHTPIHRRKEGEHVRTEQTSNLGRFCSAPGLQFEALSTDSAAISLEENPWNNHITSSFLLYTRRTHNPTNEKRGPYKGNMDKIATTDQRYAAYNIGMCKTYGSLRYMRTTPRKRRKACQRTV